MVWMLTKSSSTVICYNVAPQIELHDADVVPEEGCQSVHFLVRDVALGQLQNAT